MKPILIAFLVAISVFASAQNEQNYKESLLTALDNAANDTIRLDINRKLGFHLQNSETEAALKYHQSQQVLAKKLDLKLWEADAYQQIGYCYWQLDNLPPSFENYMQALEIVEDPASATNGWGYSNFSYSKSPEDARKSIVGMIHFELSLLYTRTRLHQESLNHLFEAVRIGESLQNYKILSLSTRDIGASYILNNKPDSAFLYFKKALFYYENGPYKTNVGTLLLQIGEYYIQKKEYDSAKLYIRKAIHENTKPSTLVGLSFSNQALGNFYRTTGQLDSALVYTFKGIKVAESINDNFSKATGYTQLAAIYTLQNKHSLAHDYLAQGKTIADSLNDAYITGLMQFQNIGFNQKIRLQELEKENQQTKSRIRLYTLIAGLSIFLVIAVFLYRSNRLKQKANKVLESTLNNLKSTQTQLVQSEKMASLGELTAGIAHEIQNPLNFVNNFSEVSEELVQEMKEEIEKGDLEEAKALGADLEQNLKKINHHGQRASSIVKGMLEHSRTGDGTKELTDINKLADEYLRLSYHGLRAKDKPFNADFSTDFDETLPKVNVVPQDIGRVLLNLINNAFQAVNGVDNPKVEVSTQLQGNKIEIKVKDNGTGIPDDIKDKIFQPFFTTKPTGQGTGLGLSMSYDIITKGHGGKLKIASKEGEGSEFIINLSLV
jgi:two-component system, NtrC family, sensor kinase